MKVLYFHQHFTTPNIGGGTRSYEFSRKLIERGHTVTIVTGEFANLNLNRTLTKDVYRGIIDGINVIQVKIPYSNKDGVAKRAWIFIKFAWKGIQIALNEDYDMLFATSTPLTASIPGIWMKVFGKKNQKFVFEVRDLWPELPKALGMKNPFLLGGMSLLEKLSYKYADACVGLSPGICEGIEKKTQKGKVVKMIPNGCDLDVFIPGDRLKLELNGINPNDTVAVFTGAHGIANGLDSVLDMAVELKKRNRCDIKIIFIGDGKEKDHLIQRCKTDNLDNCLFFPPMPKVQLNKIISNVDIGLMILKNVPAFYYGTSPNKFFDYIASGLPVVNNYPGWLADIINENKCGIVSIADNVKSFADSIEMLANDKKLRITYGKNARKLAENNFSREKLSNQFVDFLEKINNN